jgi:DNA (cytosine-5)-methyltransferase 1
MAWKTAVGGKPDRIKGQLDMLDETGRLRADPVSVASLCSGYGGLEMALRLWLGEVDVRWHAETDPGSARVLETHWPDVPNVGDFTRPGFWSDVERCDLIAGGIPCQPFSRAGRKLGRDDPRYLWPWMRDGIKLHRPATVVFENVEGLTQGRQRPVFDEIVSDLVSLGYDVRWLILGACAIGAAHHRHRVFLLARPSSTQTAKRIEIEKCARTNLLPSPRSVDGRRGPVTERRTAVSGRKNGVELASALNLLPSPRGSERWGKYADAIARHEAVLGRAAPEPTEIGPKGSRRLAATFSEWLMMLPEGHLTSVLDRKAALGRAGNGVVPLQAATALRLLAEDLDSVGRPT